VNNTKQSLQSSTIHRQPKYSDNYLSSAFGNSHRASISLLDCLFVQFYFLSFQPLLDFFISSVFERKQQQQQQQQQQTKYLH
jgi:hypothetical protein